MTKKISRIIAAVMLAFAVGFVGFALSHPEASFPWHSNVITYAIYIIFIAAMIVLFAAPFKKSK